MFGGELEGGMGMGKAVDDGKKIIIMTCKHKQTNCTNGSKLLQVNAPLGDTQSGAKYVNYKQQPTVCVFH